MKEPGVVDEGVVPTEASSVRSNDAPRGVRVSDVALDRNDTGVF